MLATLRYWKIATILHRQQFVLLFCLFLALLLPACIQLDPFPTHSLSSPGLVRALQGHTSWANDADWSPDGKYIASGSNDGTIRIWDPSGNTLHRIETEHGSPKSLAWSPDSKQLAAGILRPSERLVMWEAASWKIAWATNPKGAINAVEYSPDGAYIAVGMGFVDPDPNSGKQESGIDIYDAVTGRLSSSLPYTDDVYSVSWSPDSQRLGFRAASPISSRENDVIGGHAAIWDVSACHARGDHATGKGTLQDVIKLPQIQVTDVLWSPNSNQFALAADDALQLWDTNTYTMTSRLVSFNDQISIVSWSPDGKYIAFGGPPPGIQVWDLANNKLLDEHFSGFDTIESLEWSPDSKYLLTSSSDYWIRIWDALMAVPTAVPTSIP